MLLKNKLKELNFFIDNEYLEKYCRLIEQNTTRNSLPGRTNRHHIIPKSWFKLNNLEVDNSRTNLVTLDYRSHVLAHYYLCLCTTDQLKFANELALVCLISRKKKLNYSDKQLITSLPLYNYIYEDYIKNKTNGYKLYD